MQYIIFSINMDKSENDELTTSIEPSENSQDSQEEADSNLQVDEEQPEKLLQLPMGRIKTIIKSDPEINLVTREAVFLISKSTELFIDSLAKEAYKHSVQTKKKIVQKSDVEKAIDKIDELVFLEGTLD